MKVTRRQFIQGGVAAFTVTYAAPEFLSDLARAQGSSSRNLVILYLSGGNDSLSTVIPYNDPFYYSRRPTIAVPAGNVLQIGSDKSNVALGLHPKLAGLKQVFDQGRLAIIQRTGYANQSRSHFQGTDIWSAADPVNYGNLGWLGRFLDTLPSPVDALAGWNTTATLPHVMQAAHTAVPAIANPATYSFSSPNSGNEAIAERNSAAAMASHVPANQPELAFVYESAQAALATLGRVASVASYAPTAAYPANNGFAQAMKAVAGAMVKGVGTRVFYVTTGGYDTHSGQGVNQNNGTYANLMTTLNDGLFSFYTDLKNQGLLGDTLVLTFSEFGRRINESGSNGTDHGAASAMFAMGGRVNGGLYGTAPNLNPNGNPTLENGNGDVTWETDFRSVYAQVLDNWLGASSVSLLGGDFRKPSLTFV
jgi:uncharacterized protein (DUF1501 family)